MEISKIDGLIHVLRGQRVMLDVDLAELYGVEVRQLKRQVRRNKERFPEDFLFTLTAREYEILRCQIGTLSWGRHSKYLPFAFTEHGVAMLSSVLNSPRAISANIEIMRAFTRLRGILAEQRQLIARLNELEGRYDAQFKDVFAAIRQLMEPPVAPKKKIGF